MNLRLVTHQKFKLNSILVNLFLLLLLSNAHFLTAQNTDCSAIQFEITDNNLAIKNLDLLNGTLKVFDQNYQTQLDCAFDCPSAVTIPNLDLTKEAHAIFQFFDSANRYVGEIRKDFIPSNELPTIKILKGDLELNSQAEVDAYCGYEVIEGRFALGTTRDNDILDVSNLQALKIIGQNLSIVGTQLPNFTALNHIQRFNSFYAETNNLLEEIGAFNHIEELFAFTLNSNTKLTQLNGFKQVKKITLINLRGDNDITNFTELNQLDTLGTLELWGNDKLITLEGFANLKHFSTELASRLTINNNPKLEKIAFVSPITNIIRRIEINNNPLLSTIEGINVPDFNQLIIKDNLSLNECCDVLNLVQNIRNSSPLSFLPTIENNGTHCSSVQDILNHCDAPPINTYCENLLIEFSDNSLKISGLAAPNTIVKVFNQNWQLIFNCQSDCTETVSVADLEEGEYHTDVQFYDENWNFICEDKQDLTYTNSNPCQGNTCSGDVILQTQADVDAFCGCEVIEGNLVIGFLPNGALSDISSLANLSNLKKVNGSLSVTSTPLNNLEGLENVTSTGINLVLNSNPNLQSLFGLNGVRNIGSLFVIVNNPNLIYTADLNDLETLGSGLILAESGVEDVTFLGNLQNDQIERLEIRVCPNLKSLDGLASIKRVVGDAFPGVLINENNGLTDISGMQNMTLIDNGLVVFKNPSLETCCSLLHLIDDNQENGVVNGIFQVGENANTCSSFEAILDNCNTMPPVSCDNITIDTDNNRLTINGLTAPNVIVKVFDENYQIIFTCAGDCETSTIITSLAGGKTYHTDVQFYDENWNFICEDKQDIDFPFPDLCSDAICLGDVTLRNQADLDAFCGCEVIQGDLNIAPEGFFSNDEVPVPADIIDISVLSNLREVKGTFNFISSLLTDLKPLSNLTTVGGAFSIKIHKELTSLEGLENLESIGGFLELAFVPKLKNLDDLKNLKRIGALSLIFNDLENIEQLKQLEVTRLNALLIIESSKLKNLEGLNGLETLATSDNIAIISNAALENLDALKNVKLIEGNLLVIDNPLLNNCCSIAHLIDEDDSNGKVTEGIQILDNPAFCNSTAAILENCENTSSSPCENININYVNNELNISGLTAPITILKVFDKDWQQLYDCFADCDETITIPNLNSPLLRVQIANYDENWNFLCHGDEDIASASDRNRFSLFPEDFTLSPNPVAQNEVYLDLNRLVGESANLKIINQFGKALYQKRIEKVTKEKEKIDVTHFSNGLYFVEIQSENRRAVSKKLLISRLY